MHELSIALSILEIAESHARAQGASVIRKIKIRAGQFSGVEKDALEFSLEAARAGTLAASSIMEIEIVPVALECRWCGPVAACIEDFSLLCPDCSAVCTVTAGRELEVEYIEVD